MTLNFTRRSFVRLFSAGSIASMPMGGRASIEDPSDQPNSVTRSTKGQFSGSDYHFSSEGDECIIDRPDPPAPWMNLLSNDSFLTWITHRGLIECSILDRSHNGLTNPQETSGFVYVRDRASGKYFCVNLPEPDMDWQCRHGLGYTAVTAHAMDLRVEVTYFVPREADLVTWRIAISSAGQSRDVDVFSAVEWNLGDQNKQLLFKNHGGGGDAFTGGSQFNLFKHVSVRDGVIYAQQPIWLTLADDAKAWPYTGFMASSAAPVSYECVKQNFLGNGRTASNPVQVEQGTCGNHQLWSDNHYPWGVLHHRMGVERAREGVLVVVTGMARDATTIPAILERHANLRGAEQDLDQVKTFWQEFRHKTIRVNTPEPEIDRMVNVWAKYQWRNNMLRSQTTGRYGLGFWSYGLVGSTSGGALTEVVAQPHDLSIVRDAVLQFLSLQYRDTTLGKLYDEAPLMPAADLGHPWPPKPSRGPFRYPHSHETDNIYPIAQYVVESGDLNFLEQKAPWLDGGEGTVFEHIENALKYATQGLSHRGLPRLSPGIGDWNDDLNGLCKNGDAESIMLAMELCYHLRECANLAQRADRARQASGWMEIYERIKNACNRYAWDGDWYVRAFSDRGPELIPVGTAKDKEARIFLNTQSWAVISGVAEGDRAGQCMKSVQKHLVSEEGPMLYAPAYTRFDARAGIQSASAPGWRNANIYFRPAGWAIIAACLADLPDLAFDMYRRSCLSGKTKDILRYVCEPYVYSENVNGPDHPMAGRGQYQWNLGEGTNWMWRSYVYYILGVRPVIEGLLVDPRIPVEWPGFSLSRQFRGASYEIIVHNPRRRSMGVRRVTVDGTEISGKVIPAFTDGKTHHVDVTLEA